VTETNAVTISRRRPKVYLKILLQVGTVTQLTFLIRVICIVVTVYNFNDDDGDDDDDNNGKALCWDVTITCPLADSYIIAAVRESGTAAELAASRKEEKYPALDGRYIFEPIAIETLGIFNTSARQLLSNLGR